MYEVAVHGRAALTPLNIAAANVESRGMVRRRAARDGSAVGARRRSSDPLVHGDLVGGEYGCVKGQKTRAEEPRPQPRFLCATLVPLYRLRRQRDRRSHSATALIPVWATGVSMKKKKL